MSQEPLGTLLLKRGLITDEQLAAALADQKATGEPLGKIVVDRGYAASATVAQALATQHGGLLKTEYGFATGFESGAPVTSFVEPPVTPPKPARPQSRAAVAVVEDRPVVDPEADRGAVRAELSLAAAETEKLQDDNARLVELRSKLEQRLATESQRVASLERELVAAKEHGVSDSELEQQLADAARRLAELEAGLQTRDAAIEEWQAGVAERDAAIEKFKEVSDLWEAGLAERDAAIVELRAAHDDALAQLEGAGVKDKQERDDAVEQLRAVERELVELTATREPALAELATARDEALAELRDVKGALATRDAAVHALTVERDEAVAQVRATAAENVVVKNAQISGLEHERDSAVEQLRAREVELAELAAARDEALARRQAAEGAVSRVSELVKERDDALARLSAAETEVAELAAARDEAAGSAQIAGTDAWAAAERHLLFFQGPKGYELVERDGPPPAPGAQLELETGMQVVARIAASPAPGPRVPCAYLVAA